MVASAPTTSWCAPRSSEPTRVTAWSCSCDLGSADPHRARGARRQRRTVTSGSWTLRLSRERLPPRSIASSGPSLDDGPEGGRGGARCSQALKPTMTLPEGVDTPRPPRGAVRAHRDAFRRDRGVGERRARGRCQEHPQRARRSARPRARRCSARRRRGCGGRRSMRSPRCSPASSSSAGERAALHFAATPRVSARARERARLSRNRAREPSARTRATRAAPTLSSSTPRPTSSGMTIGFDAASPQTSTGIPAACARLDRGGDRVGGRRVVRRRAAGRATGRCRVEAGQVVGADAEGSRPRRARRSAITAAAGASIIAATSGACDRARRRLDARLGRCA